MNSAHLGACWKVGLHSALEGSKEFSCMTSQGELNENEWKRPKWQNAN